MNVEIDRERAAVEAPFDHALLITGAAGTGKSTTLRMRAERFARERPGSPSLFVEHPDRLARLALEVLELADARATIIDDVEAEVAFARCAQPLFAMDWHELAAGTIDPEVPGLRSPERFAESAFRLIRKLRDALISPETFVRTALAGATEFYAKPPNFAHPNLILATKDTYRNSLDVSPAELQRQHKHEVDLAKILGKLYGIYVEGIRESRRMTARDAIAEAVDVLRATPAFAAEQRRRYEHVFIDQAEEMTAGARLLLEAIYGPKLEGVTLAGDEASATSTFAGARPKVAMGGIETAVDLREDRRGRAVVESLARFKSVDDEARFIARSVRERIQRGTAAENIALVFRSVGDVHEFEEALLSADVAAIVSGDTNVFADARALDALALLWNVWDPFRHEWLLRTLAGPACALSDASLATLCQEPPDAQTLLFIFDDEPAPTTRSGRWDPKRDLRLGWNVLRGDQDATLASATARERVQRFRALRAGWVEAMPVLPFGAFVRRVWREGLAIAGTPGSARARAQQIVLRRLYERLTAYAAAHPAASLGDILAYAEARSATSLESCEPATLEGFVQLMSVDAARGREFDVVFVPDARAGSFPRWYVSDSFMYSPKLGMIAKDNVGDARASRTAKYSYYVAKARTREAYNDEERRAFLYALRRARREAIVSASGRATRGTTAPEFAEELRKA